MSNFRIALYFLFLLPCTALGQETSPEPAEITIKQIVCGGSLAPPKAFVANLLTGRGTSTVALDESRDTVPPCGGSLPKVDLIQAIPMNWIIPQLVKIISDGGQCSGALVSIDPTVGAKAIVTAAHCVYSNGNFFKNLRVYPGYNNGTNPRFGEIRGTEVLAFSRYTADRQTAHDIAVIKLEEGLT